MVKVVTDSACDLPEDLIRQYDIAVVPLKIRFDDEEFVDRIDLSTEQFWDRANKSDVLPATAAPSPGDFEQAFRKAGEGAVSVVCINLSSALSATYQAAITAASSLDGFDITVIDSRQCTVAEGALVLEAAKLASEGATKDVVVTAVEALRDRLKLVGALDTLDNLRKGGRIGAAGAFFGSLLSVKPLITIEEGSVKALSRQRTRRKALSALTDLVKADAPIDHVAISHAQANDIEEILDLLQPVVAREQVLVCDIGPVIGSHGGPRTVAVCYATAEGT